MSIRDLTLSDVRRLELQAGAADVPLYMDEEAFRAFYDRTARGLGAYLARVTGDRTQAEDLLQEAYYRFLRAGATHESEAHRRNSLFRIATNLAHDARRRKMVRPFQDPKDAGDLDIADSKPDHGRNHQTRTDLTRAMAHLKPRERAILWLAYAQGSSHREIADTIGVQTGSIKLMLFRARRKLAGFLGRQVMNFMPPRKIECEFEADVLAAVATRRWPFDSADSDLAQGRPARVDPALVAHAATCEICADAVAVAAAFRDDEEVLPGDMRLPDSSIVWWRSQLRAREEAARAAARPITIAQVAGVSCAVGLAGVVFGASNAWLQGWLSWAWTGIKSFSLPTISFTLPTISIPAPVVTLVTEHALLVGGIAALLIIGPVAVYLAARE